MRLKHYQEKVITTLKDYLGALADARAKYEKFLEIDAETAKGLDFQKPHGCKALARTFTILKQTALVSHCLTSI